VKEGLASLYEAQRVPRPNQAGSALTSNANSDTPVYKGTDPQINLSDVELEELFKSFEGGASGTQEPFKFGLGNETWASHFEVDNSFLLDHEDRSNAFGAGLPDMSYLQ